MPGDSRDVIAAASSIHEALWVGRIAGVVNGSARTVCRRPEVAGEVEEDDLDRACSTHGGEEECVQVCGPKPKRKETTR
jgi:hypothetical protein